MSTDRFTEILNYLSAMSREIGEFRSETKARLDALETRMGGVETRIDGVETRLGGLEAEMRVGFKQVREDIRLLGRQVEVMTKDLIQVRGRQLDHEARLDAFEAR